MLLTFLVCSIGLAHAEPDTTSSGNAGSDVDGSGPLDRLADPDDARPDELDELTPDERESDALEPDALEFDALESDALDERALDPVRAQSSFEGRAPAALDDEGRIDGVATDGLGDAQVDAPAPASLEADPSAPTWAHGLDAREAALRRHRSWLGRLDVSITWRRALSESTAVQRDEVWLVGTWRL